MIFLANMIYDKVVENRFAILHSAWHMPRLLLQRSRRHKLKLLGIIDMQIQINTDKNISGDEALAKSVEDILRFDLSSFSHQISRIEIHLSDENSAAKSGMTDKRCLLEVRLAGEHPVAVSEHARTVGEAVTGATQKMANLLEAELGKRGKW